MIFLAFLMRPFGGTHGFHPFASIAVLASLVAAFWLAASARRMTLASEAVLGTTRGVLKAAQRPVLQLLSFEMVDGACVFMARNIGAGPALNLQCVTTNGWSKQHTWSIPGEAEAGRLNVDMLAVGQTGEARVVLADGLDFSLAENRQLLMYIESEDLAGNSYRTGVAVTNDGEGRFSVTSFMRERRKEPRGTASLFQAD